MRKVKQLIKVTLVSGFLLGVCFYNVNASGYEQNIDNNSLHEINTEVNDKSNSKLNADDFKQNIELPEKTYDSERWSDDLYTPEELIGGKTDVTIKDFEDIVMNRMLDVVSLLQTFGKPFCIIMFILSALGLLISIVFSTQKQKAFSLGLILSVIAYVAIIFAPDIVLFFSDWLSF